MTPCCIDTKCALEIGNVHTQSLREIYLGDTAHRLRLAHLAGDLRAYPRCDTCDCPYLSVFAEGPWLNERAL